MSKKHLITSLIAALALLGCQTEPRKTEEPMMKEKNTPFFWDAANVYFMLTDRFHNGDPSNDTNFDRTEETGVLRGFEGGDIKGIIKKLEEGYFEDLGVNAIWFTPVVEQIHGVVDEGTGPTYAYHGYWAKDWTAFDPNFGTEEDLAKLVALAHEKNIRVLLDVVINHTGPVTDADPVWGDSWVRTGPACNFSDFEGTTSCTLVENLPDILTDSDEEAELPQFLIQKWEAEGRLEQEITELDAFFEATGHPRAPRFYIMKWLTDMVSAYGIDGFRVDTVKHTEAYVWQELFELASQAFENWKKEHPEKVLDNTPFYMVGEVYNYNINGGRDFDYGDRKVDFFDHGFHSLINFGMKWDAHQPYEEAFQKYDSLLHGQLKGKSVLNYLSSHDDGSPFDAERNNNYESAIRLMLTPGAAQIYYGDETARPLIAEGAIGDANLRTFMNWDALQTDPEIAALHKHWQKLGTFRRDHPAVGAGRHQMITAEPYTFSRIMTADAFQDKVVIGIELPKGKKSISTGGVFKDGEMVRDHYSGETAKVTNGKAEFDTPFDLLLLSSKL